MTSEVAAQWECTVTDGRILEPCDGLASIIQGNAAFSKGKGIRYWEYRKRNEPGVSRWFVGAKSDSHPDGLCFSYCPICGTDISAPFDSTRALEAKEGKADG